MKLAPFTVLRGLPAAPGAPWFLTHILGERQSLCASAPGNGLVLLCLDQPQSQPNPERTARSEDWTVPDGLAQIRCSSPGVGGGQLTWICKCTGACGRQTGARSHPTVTCPPQRPDGSFFHLRVLPTPVRMHLFCPESPVTMISPQRATPTPPSKVPGKPTALPSSLEGALHGTRTGH